MAKGYQKFLIPVIYIAVAISLMMGVILILSGVSKYLNGGIDYKYTLDNVFNDTTPVVNVKNDSIIRPYISILQPLDVCLNRKIFL
jgi:hypothetical protein